VASSSSQRQQPAAAASSSPRPALSKSPLFLALAPPTPMPAYLPILVQPVQSTYHQHTSASGCSSPSIPHLPPSVFAFLVPYLLISRLSSPASLDTFSSTRPIFLFCLGLDFDRVRLFSYSTFLCLVPAHNLLAASTLSSSSSTDHDENLRKNSGH
jgi:hypothetical protein